MGKLSIYLPAYASDYTGVCSALYDLDFLTVITDASCCTQHYAYYDEPRWVSSPRPVFSAQLRTVDAIMGNDKKLVSCVLEAAQQVGTKGIAIVGTPVPAITGMDTLGIAKEVQKALSQSSNMQDREKLCLGFETTGLSTYDKGLALAGKVLINALGSPKEECTVVPGSINILGMSPLDYGNVENAQDLGEFLKELGFQVNCCLFMGSDLEEIKEIGKAQVNLVVSASGLVLGKHLKKVYGTPYVVAAPMGKAILRLALGKSPSPAENLSVSDSTASIEKPILIVWDQIMGNSLREALSLSGCSVPIQIASFFTWDKSIARPGDHQLKEEKNLIALMKSGDYSVIVGDPLMERIPISNGTRFVPIPHPAVSSLLHNGQVPRFLKDIPQII